MIRGWGGIDQRTVSARRDIRGFFDAIDHAWLLKFVEYRIADAKALRPIQKWLAAGVMDGGKEDAEQGGDPAGRDDLALLVNIYLHYVFDLRVDQWRKKRSW